jgi:DNA invertase Pin-like site-specific DNA recombinase
LIGSARVSTQDQNLALQIAALKKVGCKKFYEGKVSGTDTIDTGTLSGRFFFHVMASLAEMERELTIERTRAGLATARKLGRVGGRKRQMTDSKIASVKKLLARRSILRILANDDTSIPAPNEDEELRAMGVIPPGD